MLECADEALERLRGKKQKQIVEYLQQKKAFNSESALELQGLLAEVGCTNVS